MESFEPGTKKGADKAAKKVKSRGEKRVDERQLKLEDFKYGMLQKTVSLRKENREARVQQKRFDKSAQVFEEEPMEIDSGKSSPVQILSPPPHLQTFLATFDVKLEITKSMIPLNEKFVELGIVESDDGY